MQDPFNARMGESGVGKGHAGGNLGRYSMVDWWKHGEIQYGGNMGTNGGRLREVPGSIRHGTCYPPQGTRGGTILKKRKKIKIRCFHLVVA